MNKIQYNIHILLNSKYRLLLNLLLYIIIMFTYKILLNDLTIIECMNQQPTDPSLTPLAPRSFNTLDHIRHLENEILRLNSRIDLLEQGLRHTLEGRIRAQAYYESTLGVIIEENNHLRENLAIAHTRITEVTQLSNRLVQENTTLRNLVEQEPASYTTGLESNSNSDNN